MLKVNYIILIFILLFTSCKTKKHIGSTKDEYIMAYKKAVLYGCLNSATNDNFSKFIRENNDLGTAIETAVLYHSDVEHAKKVGAELSSKIRTINYSDYNGKKPIFSDCIEFAFSRYVDSIAKNKYRKLKNSKLEYISE